MQLDSQVITKIWSEQCWLEGHLICEWILRDTCEWSLRDTCESEWSLRDTCESEWSLRDTCEWSLTCRTLVIETWGTLVSYSAVNTRETTWQRHQLTNLQPNCLLPCPQITGSTGILAYFYKKVCAQKFTQGTQRDSAQAPPQLLNSFELRICPDQFGSCNARLLRWHRPKEWVTKWWTIEIE